MDTMFTFSCLLDDSIRGYDVSSDFDYMVRIEAAHLLHYDRGMSYALMDKGLFRHRQNIICKLNDMRDIGFSTQVKRVVTC